MARHGTEPGAPAVSRVTLSPTKKTMAFHFLKNLRFRAIGTFDFFISFLPSCWSLLSV